MRDAPGREPKDPRGDYRDQRTAEIGAAVDDPQRESAPARDPLRHYRTHRDVAHARHHYADTDVEREDVPEVLNPDVESDAYLWVSIGVVFVSVC